MPRLNLPGSEIFSDPAPFAKEAGLKSKRGFLKILLPGLPVSIILLLLFFILLGQSFFEVKGRIRRLELLGTEVETLRDRKAELEEELVFRQSPAYIEKEAREQLGYAKKGEVIIVLPDFEEKKEEEGQVAAADSSEETFPAEKELPIWKKNLKAWGCTFIPSSWTCP